MLLIKSDKKKGKRLPRVHTGSLLPLKREQFEMAGSGSFEIDRPPSDAVGTVFR